MQLFNALVRQWIGLGLVAIVSMSLSFLLARVLGPFEFGTYSYILSIVSIFAIAQDGGFKTLLFREKVLPSAHIYQKHDIFCTATGHLLLMTCAGLFLLFIFPLSNKYLLIPAVIFMGLRIYSSFYSAQLKGEGRFGYEAFWQVLIRVVTASAIIGALFFFAGSIISLFWAGSVSLFILVLFLIPIKSLKSFNLAHYRYLFQSALFFLVIDAATVIYFRSDIILLKYIHPESLDTGYYSASYRLIEGVILMIAPISQICFRHLRLQIEEMEQFVQSLKIMFFWALVVALILAVLGYFLGPWITTLIYGEGFVDAGILTQWLSFSLLFIIPNAILTQTAIALNIEKKYAIAAVLVALVNIGLNFWMIPLCGGVGAVWATLASEGVLFITLFASVYMVFKKKYFGNIKEY